MLKFMYNRNPRIFLPQFCEVDQSLLNQVSSSVSDAQVFKCSSALSVQVVTCFKSLSVQVFKCLKCLSVLKIQSCKLYNNKYMIAPTQRTNTEIFAFTSLLVFKLLSRKVLFINKKDNRNC